MAAAYVQSVAGEVKTAGQTVVLPSNVIVGNTIIVLRSWSYSPTNPGYTDGLGNTYTHRGARLNLGPGTNTFDVFTAPVTTGGACTITQGAGAGQTRWIIAIEVSGLATGNCFDVENAASDSANPCNAGSITPTQNGDYLAAVFYRIGTSANSYAPGSGWTERHEFAGDTHRACMIDQVQAVAAAINAETTAGAVNGSYPILGYVASFKAAAVAGPPVVRGLLL